MVGLEGETGDAMSPVRVHSANSSECDNETSVCVDVGTVELIWLRFNYLHHTYLHFLHSSLILSGFFYKTIMRASLEIQ